VLFSLTNKKKRAPHNQKGEIKSTHAPQKEILGGDYGKTTAGMNYSFAAGLLRSIFVGKIIHFIWNPLDLNF
jgi:hypothetical protein